MSTWPIPKNPKVPKNPKMPKTPVRNGIGAFGVYRPGAVGTTS